MAGLGEADCCRAIRRINIGPALDALADCHFEQLRHRGNYQGDLICGLIRQTGFPPAMMDFVDGLGLGGRVGRAVLRRLNAGQGIPLHTDEWMPGEVNWRRFQVPLVSDPRIVMRWPDDGVEQHLEPGWLWEVRYDRPHEVVNPTECCRVHLQVDQIEADI